MIDITILHWRISPYFICFLLSFVLAYLYVTWYLKKAGVRGSHIFYSELLNTVLALYFGALWELGQCSGVGLEIDLKKIPIRQETIEICEFFDLNPYKLLSGGSLLLAAADGNALVHAIRQAGGEAVIIGRTIDSNDRVLINGEERRFLETTQTDELWNMVKCN